MSGPADTPPPKVDPETLALRARPRPVTRFNRRVLIAGTAFAAAILLGLAFLALEPPTYGSGQGGEELLDAGRNRPADGLEALPRDYGEVRPVPRLGPALSGDIGPAVVQMERDLGLGAPASGPRASIFRPDPEEDLSRAERLRLARQAQQASEAGVFFQISAGRESGAGGATAAALPPDAALDGAGDRASGLALDREADSDPQGRKLAFLARPADTDTLNPHALEEPVSPFQLMAGTVIAASLVTGINSDLPGMVIAQVTGHVYDTATGRHLLIPQGSRLIGRYDSVVAFGQSRALVVWNRIVMPDGWSIVIENLPASDMAGYAGLEDEVDFHTWRLVKGVALATLLGVGTELTLGDEESDLVRALRESAQESTDRAGQRLVERNLDIQPTITVRPGWPLRVIVHRDLVFPRPYRG